MKNDDLLETVILERVRILLTTLEHEQPSKADQEEIFKAESIIEQLAADDREVIRNYIEKLLDRMALEEPFLYKHGFIDGVRTVKKVMEL